MPLDLLHPPLVRLLADPKQPLNPCVRTYLTDEEACAVLKKVSGNFAAVLINSFEAYGSWTNGKGYWAHRLAMEYLAKPKPPPALPTSSGSIFEQTGQTHNDLVNETAYSLITKAQAVVEEAPTPAWTNLLAFMKHAQGKLKSPSLLFKVEGNDYTFKLNKNGCIYVRVGGGYLFTIYPDATTSLGLFSALKPHLKHLCLQLCARPAYTIAKHGKAMGACCYCKKKLTDPPSVEAGYGPTCAKHYNLPWGTKK